MTIVFLVNLQVEESYVTTNSFGGIVTLICWIGISLLLYTEINDFLVPSKSSKSTRQLMLIRLLNQCLAA